MTSLVENHSTTWIKIWIGLGILGFFLLLIIPATLGSAVLKDRLRFVQCEKGQRQDCGGSAIWAMYDWKLDGSSATTTQPIVEPSPSAPQIVSASISEASFANGRYQVTAGSRAKVIANVMNAKTVTLYLIDPEAPAAKRLTGLTLQKDGTYTGSFLVSPGLQAELEVRAMNEKDEISSLRLKVSTN